jgi:peroxiredoxin
MNPALPEGTFTFVPPEGAEEEDELGGGFGDMFSGATDDPGMSELLGEEAPNFALQTLDGERFQLTEHEGQIVVLDFFTTWADDVGKVLKAHGEVAQEYADEDVTYLAVDQSESEDVVRGFLESVELSIPVALDNGGVVGTLYEREDMPYTVIIGEDGTVEQATTTYGDDVAGELRESIDTLLAGESLAEAAMASQFT